MAVIIIIKFHEISEAAKINHINYFSDSIFTDCGSAQNRLINTFLKCVLNIKKNSTVTTLEIKTELYC